MDPKALVSTPIWFLAVAAVVWLGRSWLEGALKSRWPPDRRFAYRSAQSSANA